MSQNFLSNINIHLLYGTKTKCDANWKGINQICTYHKLYYIISGSCIIEINGNKYTGEKNRLFLIPANTRHSFYHEGDDFITKYWMHFNFEANSDNPFKGITMPPFITVDHPRITENNFKTALSATEQLSDLLLQKAKIMEIIAEFLKHCPKRMESETAPVERAIDYIKNHTDRDITVEHLATQAHLHPNYFIRLFKQHTGMPPIRYVTIVKIEEAKSLLERTDTPINHISSRLGYKDPAHFSNVFKSVCGYSPRQFRQRFQEKGSITNVVVSLRGKK